MGFPIGGTRVILLTKPRRSRARRRVMGLRDSRLLGPIS